MEIRGELATRSMEPIRLSRNARSILNGAMSRVPAMKERRVELTGRIRELNERLMRFELHDVKHPPSTVRVCEFDADLWDAVYEMLGVEETVNVLGIETSMTSIVRVIGLIRPDTAGSDLARSRFGPSASPDIRTVMSSRPNRRCRRPATRRV